MANGWLVVGLGNPGPTYQLHRHNIGYLVLDELARRAGAGFSTPRGMRAEVCETRIGPLGTGAIGPDAQKVILARSRTYMNELGGPVSGLVKYHRIPVEQVIAVHDELDLDQGVLRLKKGGGDNGHNGLKSMRASLGSGDFHRVRFGIGRPPGRQAPADFVLSDFPASVRPELEVDIVRAADAIEALVTDGLAAAQNRFNG
ncbi:aminoacyl-tRNA hydrolase [Naumannella sp. ID2617S]|uniref:Peptidyl-tRNA hydrolase n=1 Tax=Enemella dayhoffiae TaxID=2016507 RepID=A0A255GQI5_9ACTN|nr:aminoacyl-tRNA hydrolase [Enemella dayhoffiae]NNG18290.1 aminoacyl-tRNA hydrolase [Naumannella sp. ID2617S]OYO18090.1 aminoacyl-tRNA hydrolase [Enemella dayhoffiae]